MTPTNSELKELVQALAPIAAFYHQMVSEEAMDEAGNMVKHHRGDWLDADEWDAQIGQPTYLDIMPMGWVSDYVRHSIYGPELAAAAKAIERLEQLVNA